jgi:hypothetical protein
MRYNHHLRYDGARMSLSNPPLDPRHKSGKQGDEEGQLDRGVGRSIVKDGQSGMRVSCGKVWNIDSALNESSESHIAVVSNTPLNLGPDMDGPAGSRNKYPTRQ